MLSSLQPENANSSRNDGGNPASTMANTSSLTVPTTARSTATKLATDSNSNDKKHSKLRRISLSYSNSDSHASALRLVLTLKPDWKTSSKTIEFIRFTDGITNTLLKAVNKLPGLSDHDIDREAILLRAYGKGTDVLIDRDRETKSHSLLASYSLAPPLLARFDNGLLYRFIEGTVCNPEDLRRKEVWRAVARRLGEWHATLPVSSIASTIPSTLTSTSSGDMQEGGLAVTGHESYRDQVPLTPSAISPSVWTVIGSWIEALPTGTRGEMKRKTILADELRWIARELGNMRGIDGKPFVFAHCDLLCGNVIILPQPARTATSDATDLPPDSSDIAARATVTEEENIQVSFIDYEYATAAPAAFDIANHFAEWGGFDCDFSVLPTRTQRRDFLDAYLTSYNSHLSSLRDGKGSADHSMSDPSQAEQVEELLGQVDDFRGLPGFYWGIWALIQAMISQIDFDYATYAEVRLSEYWAWKAAWAGLPPGGKQDEEVPLRERRWAEE